MLGIWISRSWLCESVFDLQSDCNCTTMFGAHISVTQHSFVRCIRTGVSDCTRIRRKIKKLKVHFDDKFHKTKTTEIVCLLHTHYWHCRFDHTHTNWPSSLQKQKQLRWHLPGKERRKHKTKKLIKSRKILFSLEFHSKRWNILAKRSIRMFAYGQWCRHDIKRQRTNTQQR